ncbi:transposase [Gemmatimonadetes bacterium T265]|nr:transposase [Gemmatimonadetes bacterium T265]
MDAHGLSVVRACRIAGLSRAAYYAPPQDALDRDAAVIEALTAVASAHPSWGFWKCCARLRFTGHAWNAKRVYRVYCALRLNRPRRAKRRVPTRDVQPLAAPAALNRTWAVDFMSDTLYDGRRFRTLNVLDEGNREALAVEIATSLPGARVVAVLNQLVAIHGTPNAIRCDNGPALVSEPLRFRAERQQVALRFIQPGKPNQNADIERFNRTYRREVLDAYLFASLAEVRAVTEAWLTTYNTERPHDSLGEVPPLTFLPRPTSTPDQSSFRLSA